MMIVGLRFPQRWHAIRGRRRRRGVNFISRDQWAQATPQEWPQSQTRDSWSQDSLSSIVVSSS